MVGSRLFGLIVAFVACALAADYFADERACLNIQPGLWVRDENDCMVAHQCGFDAEIVQSVRCNASQVWSKLASACVWEWDPDRDDCNGSPQVPIASKYTTTSTLVAIVFYTNLNLKRRLNSLVNTCAYRSSECIKL